ncbi:MutS family protein MSH4 [Sporobolomyces salmoneus]|uniref:MutS family protein MSH4 n=1 Tax=Sporobolomyces salmoneus TaxID=183962 RepID=UPI0031709E19
MSSLRPPSRSYSTSRPTTAQSRTGDPSSDQFESLVAILQSRQGKEVAAVAYHEEFGKITLTQFGDSSTFVKTLTFLKSNPPYGVIVLPSAKPAQRSTLETRGNASSEATLLVRCIQDEFPRTNIIPVKRQYWDEQAGSSDLWLRCSAKTHLHASLLKGYEFLYQLSAKDHERINTIETSRAKHYALSAICALLKYLESTKGIVFSPHSLKIVYAPFEGTCLIDSDSAKNLELVQNVLDQKSKQSLLGMLDRCYTPSGSRMLRANILAPSTDQDQIMGRYEAVEELVYSEERLRSLRQALAALKNIDLEKLTSKILSSTSSTKFSTSSSRVGRSTKSLLPSTGPDPSSLINQKLSHLLNLRTFLLSLGSLRTSLEFARTPLLAQSLGVFEDERLDEMRRTVEENVNQDLWAIKEPLGQKRGRGGTGGGDGGGGGGETRKLTKASRLFAIRSEKKKFLDVARETYRENLNDVNEFRDGLKAELGFEISLVNTDKGEFLLECSKEDWAEKGNEVRRKFTNINEKGKTVRFSSLELQKRNARISESILEVLLLSDEILDEIFEDIRENVACLYRCSEAVALLDMLASFADISSQHEYVRPELTGTLAIKSGRNPLHEQFRMSDGSFVPNDTYASYSSTFQLISGSNMSGKSTLLRQIALLHVMAQIGCFVPAYYASFRPVSALLTRFSNDDNIEASLSTFAQEMTTMSMILGAIEVSDQSKPCLVLIDELGRGTSPEEGVGIAHAIAEEITKSRAVCFFATHFKELATTLSRFPNVVSLHLETEIDRSQPDYSLSFHHRLIDGTDPLVHYGLELAKIAKLPTPLIDKAHLVAATLDILAETKRVSSTAYKVQRRKQGLLSLKGTLQELADSTQLEGSTLLEILREIKKETITMWEETELPPSDESLDQDQEEGEQGEDVKPNIETQEQEEEEESLSQGGTEVESLDRVKGAGELGGDDLEMLSLDSVSRDGFTREDAKEQDEEMLDLD